MPGYGDEVGDGKKRGWKVVLEMLTSRRLLTHLIDIPLAIPSVIQINTKLTKVNIQYLNRAMTI